MEEFEWTPELEAELLRAEQDMNDGFYYTSLMENGKLSHDIKCNKCGRVGKLLERPFPHKLGCPMARY